jgi:hypothetical protein
MPQLIAMIIVVVGAMIYMFQTFGGTGDKVEGIAQKTSIITEINNIKNGLQIAARGGDIVHGTTLETLANTGYFAQQINEQLTNANNNAANANIYNAISFGGGVVTGADNTSDMQISLVTPTAANENARPGIFVDLTNGNLANNAAFLESQIATDLAAIASIDRTATDTTAVALDENGDVPVENAPITVINAAGNAGTVAANAETLTDGTFTIYFKDIPAGIE